MVPYNVHARYTLKSQTYAGVVDATTVIFVFVVVDFIRPRFSEFRTPSLSLSGQRCRLGGWLCPVRRGGPEHRSAPLEQSQSRSSHSSLAASCRASRVISFGLMEDQWPRSAVAKHRQGFGEARVFGFRPRVC